MPVLRHRLCLEGGSWTIIAASGPWRKTLSEKRLTTGAQVAFRLGDAICPDFDQVIVQTGPDLAVAGEVVLLSDRGKDKEYFAIVNVPGINAPLVVPVAKLRDGNLIDEADVATRAGT